jgi:aspartate/methionine/tyrosine aminotransferase
LGSQEFIAKLKEEQNVLLSPGDRFGTDGFIRVPLIRPVPVLKDVVGRLKEFKDGL